MSFVYDEAEEGGVGGVREVGSRGRKVVLDSRVRGGGWMIAVGTGRSVGSHCRN